MKLRRIIEEQVESILESLKRENMLFEQEVTEPEQLTDTPAEEESQAPTEDPLAAMNIGASPTSSPTGDIGTGDLGGQEGIETGEEITPEEAEDEVADEELDDDPVKASVETLKTIAVETDDITEIITAIKAIAQEIFSTPDVPDETKPSIEELLEEIENSDDKDLNLVKKALKRPELGFLKDMDI